MLNSGSSDFVTFVSFVADLRGLIFVCFVALILGFPVAFVAHSIRSICVIRSSVPLAMPM